MNASPDVSYYRSSETTRMADERIVIERDSVIEVRRTSTARC